MLPTKVALRLSLKPGRSSRSAAIVHGVDSSCTPDEARGPHSRRTSHSSWPEPAASLSRRLSPWAATVTMNRRDQTAPRVGTLARLPAGVRGDARFSPDRRYRYWLERRWDASLPRFTYILLNPSTAGHDHDDKTNQRLRAITVANGGGGYELVNLFAVVDTYQVSLHRPAAVEETPGANDEWVTRAAARAEVVVLGWGDGTGVGTDAAARRTEVKRRAGDVWPLVRDYNPQCFTVNVSGAPGHPLYLNTTSPMTDYVPSPGYLTA